MFNYRLCATLALIVMRSIYVRQIVRASAAAPPPLSCACPYPA